MKLQESERTEFKSIVVQISRKEIIAFANCDWKENHMIELKDDGQLSGRRFRQCSIASKQYG